MKKFALGLIALLLPLALFAQTPPVMNIGLFWIAPTEYVDGTPIGPGELTKFTVRCGTSASALNLVADVPPTSTSYSRGELVALGLPFGVGYCNLTATTSNGLTSAPSQTAAFNIEDRRVPEAPGLSVQ